MNILEKIIPRSENGQYKGSEGKSRLAIQNATWRWARLKPDRQEVRSDRKGTGPT